MRFDRAKTLTELEGHDWGEPTYPSSLVRRCHAARKVPLDQLGVSDLLTLLGQGIGVPYVLPVAVDRLLASPILDGDLYPGALLRAACGVATAPELRYALGLALEIFRGTGEKLDVSVDLPAFTPEAWDIDAAFLARLHANGAPDGGPRDLALADRIGTSEVYGDWLLERGEPRGAMGRAPADHAAALMAEHGARWLGPATLANGVARWRGAFVDSLAIDTGALAACRQPYELAMHLVAGALSRPACAFVRELVILACDDGEARLGTLAGAPTESLETIVLERTEPHARHQLRLDGGALFASCRKLRAVVLVGDVDVFGAPPTVEVTRRR